jgi:hypothetical protein
MYKYWDDSQREKRKYADNDPNPWEAALNWRNYFLFTTIAILNIFH